MKKKLSIYHIGDIVVVLLMVVMVCFVGYRIINKHLIYAKDNDEKDMVTYQGHKYAYNEDLYTVLFMGLDSRDMNDAPAYDNVKNAGVQSDTLILFILNTKEKSLKVLPISRDTITSIDIYDFGGNRSGTSKAQITLQYAYAGGGKKSAEATCKAVSNLLYGVKVDKYCALDLDSISKLNDAIGGVTVDVIETLDEELVEGKRVTLHGEQAETYVRNRFHDKSGGNGYRMERQKQYFREYVKTFIKKMKADITLPLDVFSSISDDMNTNIKTSEFVKLVSTFIKCDLSDDVYLSEPGEIVFNETTSHDEFIVDDKAMFDLVLKTFYKKVD